MTGVPRGLRALAHRDFRLFIGGQLVSLIGTWMQSVGQAWLVLELTNSPFRLGMIGTLQFAPMLLFSFAAGAISDRVRKRRMILGTQTVLMLQALVLAILVASGHVQYWHVAVLASVYGIANTFDMPARQAFVADLVGKSDLMNAIALNSAMFNAARVIGPAVGGLLVARWGTAAAFFVNAASFVAVILALLAVRNDGLPRPRASKSFVGDIGEGVHYALATPPVALVFGLLLTVSLFVINYNVLVPLIARDVLGEGAHGFGLLMASLGAGAITGAAVMAGLNQPRPPLPMVIVPALVVSIGTMALGAARHFPLAAGLLGVIGLAQILFMTSCNTTVQITVPDELRGRLMSLYAMVFVGMTPIGSFLVGTIAEHAGVATACLAGGGAGVVSVLALTAAARRHRG
jgi:MFS family permease